MIVLVVGVAVVAGVLRVAGRVPRPGLALVAGLALGPTATAFLTPLAAYRAGAAPALAAACCVAAVAACLMLQGIAAGSGRALALPVSWQAWSVVLGAYYSLALATTLRWGGLEAWRSAPWFALVCLAGVALMALGRPAGFPLLLAGGAGHALWRTCQLVFMDVEWNWGSAALPAAIVLADFAMLAVSWLLLADPWSKCRINGASSLKLAAGPAAGLAAAAALIATTVDWDALVLLAILLEDLNGFAWVGDLLQIALFTGAFGVPGLIAVKRWCVDGRPYQPVFGGILIAWSAVAVIWWLILTAV
jgi:hypothetical protein